LERKALLVKNVVAHTIYDEKLVISIAIVISSKFKDIPLEWLR
jgi:hypothetical protein